MIRPVPNDLKANQTNKPSNRLPIPNGWLNISTTVRVAIKPIKVHQAVSLNKKKHITQVAKSSFHVPHRLDYRNDCVIKSKPPINVVSANYPEILFCFQPRCKELANTSFGNIPRSSNHILNIPLFTCCNCRVVDSHSYVYVSMIN